MLDVTITTIDANGANTATKQENVTAQQKHFDLLREGYVFNETSRDYFKGTPEPLTLSTVKFVVSDTVEIYDWQTVKYTKTRRAYITVKRQRLYINELFHCTRYFDGEGPFTRVYGIYISCAYYVQIDGERARVAYIYK